jgi:dihydrofolate reductase
MIRWLLDNDLVDQINLFIFPVVVGQGTRLFPDSGLHRMGFTRGCDQLQDGRGERVECTDAALGWGELRVRISRK